jgi:hypothetical protein
VKRRLAVIAALVTLLSLTGCDPWGDKTVATVDKVSVSVDQLRAVGNVLRSGKSFETDGRMDGTVARTALSVLVEYAVAQAGLERLGGHIALEDRSTASDFVNAQYPKLTDSQRKLLEDGISYQVALNRTLAEHLDSPLGKALVQRFADATSGRRCLLGFIGPESTGDAAFALVATAPKPSAETVTKLAGLQFEGVNRSEPQLCPTDQAISQDPPEVQALFSETEEQQWKKTVVQLQDGQKGVVLSRATGRPTQQPDSPEFRKQIAQGIQQTGAQQPEFGAFLIRDNVNIRINPRFGSGVTSDSDTGALTIDPPPAPLQLPVQQPVTQQTAPTAAGA